MSQEAEGKTRVQARAADQHRICELTALGLAEPPCPSKSTRELGPRILSAAAHGTTVLVLVEHVATIYLSLVPYQASRPLGPRKKHTLRHKLQYAKLNPPSLRKESLQGFSTLKDKRRLGSGGTGREQSCIGPCDWGG